MGLKHAAPGMYMALRLREWQPTKKGSCARTESRRIPTKVSSKTACNGRMVGTREVPCEQFLAKRTLPEKGKWRVSVHPTACRGTACWGRCSGGS